MEQKKLVKRHGLLLLLLTISLLHGFDAYAQNVTVSGQVTDETYKEGVIGVSVFVRGTSTGVITDLDGHYEISVPQGSTLVFSCIGYADQEVTVNSQQVINIVLKENTEFLEETVVVAYGTASKATITGALSSIDNTELVKSPVASVTNVLAGSVPGVSSVQGSGQPGADAATIYVRGAGSLSDASSSPLVLVDGVERDFSQIDPNEIESISVLKDASSTAVFGVRGANGVILVTTRRGESGKPSISVSSSVGLQQPVATVEPVGSYEYALFYNIKQDMDGSTSKFSKEAIEAYRTGSDPIMYPNVNWNDVMFRKLSVQSKNNVNISGGNDNIKYFISMGYLFQDGIMKQVEVLDYDNNYKYNRYNYRANLDIKVTPTTTIKLGVGGYIGVSQSPLSLFSDQSWGDTTWAAMQTWTVPMAGPGIVNGVRTLVYDGFAPSGIEDHRDGYSHIYGLGYRQNYNTELNMDIDIIQKLDFITEGLSFGIKGAYDNSFVLNKRRDGGSSEYQYAVYQSYLDDPSTPMTSVDYDKTIIYVPTGSDTPLSYEETYNRDRNWYLEARFNYDRTFNSVHKVGALLLYNQSRDYYPVTTSGSLADYWYMPRGYVGFVGRVTYAYKTRYLLDANVGYNGSENFAPGKTRYGLFPSISVGWVLTGEKWMQDQNIVDYLKIRGSFGKVGSDVGTQTRFMYKAGTWSSGNTYSFGVDNSTAQEGYGYGTPGNSEVSWETAYKQNYGFDAKFLNNRLTVNGDYFFEHRKGILITPNSTPSIIATSLPNMNVGKVDNHGFELVVAWDETKPSGLSYHLDANVSFARNKIIYMDEVAQEQPWKNQTGHSTGRTANLYQFIRLYQESDFTIDADGNYVLNPDLPQPYVDVQPGDAMFADLNGDGIVDTKDQGYYGYSSRPEYTFGLNGSISYKGFTASMQWTGAANVSKALSVEYIIPFTNQGGRGLLRHLYEGCWTPDNQEGAIYPRPAEATESWNFGSGNNASSTLWLQNASYLRLKSLNLGYTFRGGWLRNVGISAVTCTLSGYNLLTFSPMKLADPESNTTTYGAYPLSRIYSFGLNINF